MNPDNLIPITLKPDHPLIGQNCFVCNTPFDDKNPICLVPLAPAANEDARQAAKEGRMYNAVAIPLHYACANP